MRVLLCFALLVSILAVGGCNGDDDVDLAANGGGQPAQPESPESPDGPTEPEVPARPSPVTAPYADYGSVLNILPPGQDDNGGVSNLVSDVPGLGDLLGAVLDDFVGSTGLTPALTQEPHFQDQLPIYAALTQAEVGLADADLGTYFKPAPIRGPESGDWESETEVGDGEYSAEIKRDDFGVPHIFGASREDAEFGAGYATAADRLFLLDVLRRAGRGELSKFLGPADFSFDRDIARNAPYRESERTAQIANIPTKFGDDGAQIYKDSTAFVAGLNQYIADARSQLVAVPIEYLGLGVQLEPFKIEDVHAIATLIQGIFAGGGGGEYKNALLLNALARQNADPATACAVWRDLRQAYDPTSTVTTADTFATQSPRVLDDEACPLTGEFAGTYPGAVLFDDGSYQDRTYFSAEPCGRIGQPQCPDTLGNLPALPGTGVVGGLVENVIETLQTLLSLSYNDSAPAWDASRESQDAADRSWTARVEAQATGVYRALLGQALSASRWLLSKVADHGDYGYRYDAALDPEQIRARIQGVAALMERLAEGFPPAMSNALLVDARHTASGNPVAVFGPQTSYFVPQLLLEMAINGGDIHTRGMTFTGLPYVVIGRGPDFAWSATSGASDLTDVRALRLCAADGGDMQSGYMYEGSCKAFDHFHEAWAARWNLAVPTDDPASVGQNYKVVRDIVRSPDYGPVFAYATVGGQPIALASQRTTYGAELDTALPFLLATRNDVHDANSFQTVFNTTTGSFNWFYADDRDIAYLHAGQYPVRATGVYPDLPSWGDGSYDWQGFLPLERHPRDIDPVRGYLSSWNNRPAHGWWAADDNASFGPVHRNDMLEVRLKDLVERGNVTRADVVEAMGDAATVDLRGQEVLPAALALLNTGELSDDEQAAVDLLEEWSGADLHHRAMRRDRDGDGAYDDEAAVALMDAWFDPMIERSLPQLVALENVNGRNVSLESERDNAPGDMGSAYQHGYYGYLRRVFDIARGESSNPYRALRCADSDDVDDCIAALRASLDTAIEALGGIANRDNWDADEAADRIEHRAIGLSSVPPIDWQNRPTFQQVVEFNRHR